MTLGRHHAIGAVLVALLAFGGAWLFQNTEWVDEAVPAEPSEAEARDPQHRLKRVLTELGARVASPGTLDTLPPPHATLVLGGWHWNLFPERSLALRRWVESGGDLVLPYASRQSGGIDWLAVEAVPIEGTRRTPGPFEDDDDDDGSHRIEVVPPRIDGRAADRHCTGLHEPRTANPAQGALLRTYATCLRPTRTLRATQHVDWTLSVAHGPVVLRVPAGRGSVTLTALPMPWDNARVLELDNALIAATVMRAAPGREIWFVSNQARLPLLALLWERGAPAVLLGALALALALWRGAVRFGPPVATAPAARRSVAEQIRGTAGFIASRAGGAALHAAQLRALENAARLRLGGFDALGGAERAAAIAAACAMEPAALARAMQPRLTPALARHPAPALALLETARRRLLNAAPAGARPPASP